MGEHLSAGEQVIAGTGARSLAAIANQSARAVRLVLTNRQLLVLEQKVWTGGVTNKVVLEPIPLDEVAALETSTKHPLATLGVPVLVVRFALRRKTVITLGASGFGIRSLRVLTERLAQLRPGLPAVEVWQANT